MKHLAVGLAAALLAAPLSSVAAVGDKPDSLTDCVELSSGHQGTRAGSNAQLLLKDGDSYYRVAFDGECQAIGRSSAIKFETRGQANLLCPTGTRVRAANSSCDVRAIDRIEGDVYERQARRNRFR